MHVTHSNDPNNIQLLFPVQLLPHGRPMRFFTRRIPHTCNARRFRQSLCFEYLTALAFSPTTACVCKIHKAHCYIENLFALLVFVVGFVLVWLGSSIFSPPIFLFVRLCIRIKLTKWNFNNSRYHVLKNTTQFISFMMEIAKSTFMLAIKIFLYEKSIAFTMFDCLATTTALSHYSIKQTLNQFHWMARDVFPQIENNNS